MKVYIARGHGVQPSGVHDPGAVGGGWSEQTAVDVVAPACTAVLSAAGVDVFDEGEDDPNFVGSVRAANRGGFDRFVALHFDWTGGLDVHAFHHSGSAAGEALAADVVEALIAAGAEAEDNPVRSRDGLYVVRETTMPAVLIELGRIGEFGPDPTGHLTRLGVAVAHGILDHLGVARPDRTPTPTPDPTPEPEEPDVAAQLPLIDLSGVTAASGTWLRGAFVRRLQGLLVANGAAPDNTIRDDGSLDGIAGPGTKAAVRTFQSRAGIKVDGVVGPVTWTHLLGLD